MGQNSETVVVVSSKSEPLSNALLNNTALTGHDLKAPNLVAATEVPPTPATEKEPDSFADTTKNGPSLAADPLAHVVEPVVAQDTVTDDAKAELGVVASQEDPDTRKPSSALPGDDTKEKDDETAQVAEDLEKTPERKPAIPRPRKVNFEGFKNRFSEDEDIYALDVLVAGVDLLDDIRREMVTRRAKTRSAKRGGEGQIQIAKASIQPKEGGWIQRVRVQSHPIIFYLSKAAGESWPTSTPVAFHRPFTVFIYFHNKMKQVLDELEAKWADEERRQLEEKTAPKASNRDDEAEKDGVDDNEDEDGEPTDPIADSVEGLRDMRCYVKFIDDDILPLSKQFDGTAQKRVRFDDLWLLFKVGDFVWASEAMASAAPGSRTVGMYQPLWRIYTLNTTTTEFKYPSLDPTAKPRQPIGSDWDDEDGTRNDQFKVWAYYIDNDGASYGAVKHVFSVPRYSGEREITELPCYPTRFGEDSEMHIKELATQGEKFSLYLKDNHLTYNGWTLISTPDGEPLMGKPDAFDKERPLQPEYIDSHVIVDLAEAFHDMADWKPTFHKPTVYSDHWLRSTDPFPICTWSNGERTKLVDRSTNEVEQRADGVTMWQRRDGLEKDKFLEASIKQEAGGRAQPSPVLGPEDYALLPRRLFVYVLKDRKIVCVDIEKLNPIPAQVNVFDSLKIDKAYKALVKGLVSSHFAKKELERRYFTTSKTNSHSQDIIHGKGRGLVVLLHGVPGVGKTATAEAVAMEYRKPLFAITCGDLGLTPKEVEGSLTEIFRLAHMWNCVLLFDEADVFLAQRSRFDLKRNALVSVFLRILEYYNGILFLTTNRVGTLDEAFKSRIHMSLYYPPLNEIQIRLIFEMNINRLKQIEEERAHFTNEPMLDIRDESILAFANDHCNKTKESGRWNGRQIRNAFQIASSLAWYNAYAGHEEEREKNKDAELKPPVLDVNQFKKVETATDAFTKYLEQAKGYNDADLAHILGERNDFFQQKSAAATGVATATGLAAGAGAASGAAAYQQMAQYSNPYGASTNPVVGHAAQGAQFLAGYPGPMNFGQPEQGHQGGHGVDGPYNTPTRVHPGAALFETPPAPGSAGWGQGFLGIADQDGSSSKSSAPELWPGLLALMESESNDVDLASPPGLVDDPPPVVKHSIHTLFCNPQYHSTEGQEESTATVHLALYWYQTAGYVEIPPTWRGHLADFATSDEISVNLDPLCPTRRVYTRTISIEYQRGHSEPRQGSPEFLVLQPPDSKSRAEARVEVSVSCISRRWLSNEPPDNFSNLVFRDAAVV
ncbi:hypothetical protein B0T24DRAFT_716766 [Lasiosphaeria ovina]|uniref:AAA+ ATPase domain-containing protein n=1 Tax=Lasiosphaeria ovina TaxID=92902 RepID=A0AAE0KN12_9PEZI|nr:hypothetical protein B0T24DRAFT_716766 [Lasiosphaeria ovina]